MEVNEADAKYLVPSRRHPTELGALPDDWDVIELATRATIQSGIAKNGNAVLRDPVAVPYLRVANVQDGYLDLRQVAWIEIERADLTRFSVLPGDVLMNEGGDLDKLGRGALWHGQINPCVHQNHVFVVRCKAGLVPEYLNAWTSTAQARRYFMLAGRQTTNLASINKTSLGELTVAVPPTEGEQREIANAISDAETLVDSLEHLLTKKRQIKLGAMQELLTGKRRLPGYTQRWNAQLLRDISHLKSGEAITAERLRDTHYYPCYGGNGLRGYADSFTHDGHFALIGRQGALCGNVVLARGRFFASEHAVVVTPFDGVDIVWLQYVLIRMNLNQYSESSAQPGLAVERLLQLEVLVPEPAEQTAIAQALSEMDREITDLESRLTKARDLKQAMAQALLTGRIRLVEPTA
jgi:type I restriction enzyme S subunit